MSIQGKKICFTGKFPGMPRESLITEITKLGGQFHDNVKADTDILVVGDSPGDKLQKAANRSSVMIVGSHVFKDHITYLKQRASTKSFAWENYIKSAVSRNQSIPYDDAYKKWSLEWDNNHPESHFLIATTSQFLNTSGSAIPETKPIKAKLSPKPVKAFTGEEVINSLKKKVTNLDQLEGIKPETLVVIAAPVTSKRRFNLKGNQ